ncbi:LEM_emerin domain-containing protein isoform X2 [Antennarius striatus]|uniref:LEM_emerin domain-containing protein isoform X2 n=1 Tax=Antennarius striatus TaxID=241820 RepID=UPI0035B24F0A
MSSLSTISTQELYNLLEEYGIKHGPVVDSTRGLYEKKLKEAMAMGKRGKPTPDKTFYREEEEEVTYVYRTPVSSDKAGERGSYIRSRPEWTEGKFGHESSYSTPTHLYKRKDFSNEPYMYDTPTTYRNSYLTQSTHMKSGQEEPKAPKSSRLIPLWFQFVLFLVVAVILYMVFSNMETNESFQGIE